MTGPGSGTVTSIEIVPAMVSDSVGQSSQFSVVLKDSSGQIVSRGEAFWSTTDPSIARVDKSGVVTALRAGSVQINVTVQGRSASAMAVVGSYHADRWPDEPATLIPRTDQPFDGVATLGWASTSVSSGGVTIGDDPSAPMSPPHVLRFNYHTGMPGSAAPGRIYYAHAASNEVYAGFWWKASSPWQNHPSNVNKIAFWQTVTWGSSIDIQLYGPAPYHLHVVTQFPAGTNRLRPNANASDVTLGAWHRVEWHLQYASRPGVPDGLVEWWLDGVLQGRYANVQTPDDRGFGEFQLSPTWGGVGGVKTEEDYFLYDQVKISTR